MTYTVSSTDRAPVRLNETDTVANILQNVRMILQTPRGTDPMYRDFGLDWSFLDRPVNQARILIIPMVREAVEEWEPRVTVQAVEAIETTLDGIVGVRVEIEINEEVT